MKFCLIVLLLVTFSFFSFGDDPTSNTTLVGSSIDEDYLHQGRATRLAAEACAKMQEDGHSDCSTKGQQAYNNSFKDNTMNQMAPMVIQMYSNLFAVGGSFKVKNSDGSKSTETITEVETIKKDNGETEQVTKQVQKEKNEERDDNCAFLPKVIEGASQFQQQAEGNKILEQSAETESDQAKSFRTIALSHESRSKTSAFQFGGWASVAVCYAGQAAIATGKGKTLAKPGAYYAKLGGAVFISDFYRRKMNAHKERKKIMEDLADSLPKAGDCGPISDTSCFCLEKTSYQTNPDAFMKACLPKDYGSRQSQYPIPCMTSSGEPDPLCNCKSTNTCIQQPYLQFAAILPSGSTATNFLNPLNSLSNGTFDPFQGALAGDQNLAVARKALKQVEALLPKTRNISGQKDKKDLLLETGVTPKIAARLASLPKKGPYAVPRSYSSLGRRTKDSLNSAKPYVDKITSVKKNSRSNSRSRKRKSSSSSSYNPFGKFGSKKSRSRGGVTEMVFARKAMEKAQIVKRSDKNIFDIISRRYISSGIKKVDADL